MTTEPDNTLQPTSQVFADLGLSPNITFGQYLRTHRQCEGWTQVETAQRLGISKQLLSAYERGKQLPSLATGLHIAQQLELFLPGALSFLLADHLNQAGLTGWTVDLKASA